MAVVEYVQDSILEDKPKDGPLSSAVKLPHLTLLLWRLKLCSCTRKEKESQQVSLV